MSTHEAVQYILKNLPPDVSLHDVAKEIEVIAAIREGIESGRTRARLFRRRSERGDSEVGRRRLIISARARADLRTITL